MTRAAARPDRAALAVARRALVPTEHQSQCLVVQWAALMASRYPDLALLFAIPNGGHRHKAVAAKLKASGVRRGVPDLFLPVARVGCHGLFIEMKRGTLGRLTPEQCQWGDALALQRFEVLFCRSAESAQDALLDYVRRPREDA